MKDEVKEEIEWEEIAAIIQARNQGRYWDEEGASDKAMQKRLENKNETTATNADCIKLIYDYESDNEMHLRGENHQITGMNYSIATSLEPGVSNVYADQLSNEGTCDIQNGMFLIQKTRIGLERRSRSR